MFFLVLTIILYDIAYYVNAIHAQQVPQQLRGENFLDDTDSLIVALNLERIKTHLSLAKISLNHSDPNTAFSHAYLPHSVTFPAIKTIVSQHNSSLSSKIESMLTDLPLEIQTINKTDAKMTSFPANQLYNKLNEINGSLSYLSNQSINPDLFSNKAFVIQVASSLLEDAKQSYMISNLGTSSSTTNTTTAIPSTTSSAENESTNSNIIQTKQPQQEFRQVDFESALGLVNASNVNFQLVGETFDERRSREIVSFYNQLYELMMQKASAEEVISLVNAIQRDFEEELSLSEGSQISSEHSQYFSSIQSLLSRVIENIKLDNYKEADKLAVQAYLDNYEYLETPIEKHDPQLMIQIEIDMREKLREMIKSGEPLTNITSLVDTIQINLDKAKEILQQDPSFQTNGASNASSSSSLALNNQNGSKNNQLANIEGLRQGFGTFTGEKKEMGQALDPAKQEVRNNVDQIRLKLDEMLKHYKNGNYDGALIVSRSAYLDSYETIELPLRPIDPDFTLDMEIKFAELRNRIQQQSPFQQVEEKTIEIRRGLDESERLVSGIGVVAPTIAFSSSFSIIFREGLESALIIGAIITYLEASRNERFKRHVYYGIVFAILATTATWFVAESLIEISGANRALVEAIAGISAVAVLFWVSFWVLNKIETKRWIEFVKAKVWKATTTGSVLIFSMLSFFTVYREGFETVLFYQAMLSFAKYMELYVVLGMIAGLAVIVAVAVIIRAIGRRLPLKVLFGLTMGVGAYMSIVFIGNAVREFQEIDFVPTTPLLGIIPRLDINMATMTGIHPTLETVVAQFALLSVYLIGSLYVLVIQPKRKEAIKQARKSMSDVKGKRENK